MERRRQAPGLPSWILAFAACVWMATARETATAAEGSAGRWAPFVEAEFPFFSSVLDARGRGNGLPERNLTPRGLILNPGGRLWVGFDIDLLRVAAVWEGDGVTPVSMAQGSYPEDQAGRKAPEGQKELPAPEGMVWLATGEFAGAQSGVTVSRVDPRKPGPDAGEVGRGPLPPELGRFRSVELLPDGVRLHYEVVGVAVSEVFSSGAGKLGRDVRRHLEIDPHAEPMSVVVGQRPAELATAVHVRLRASLGGLDGVPSLESEAGGLLVVRIPPSTRRAAFDVIMERGNGVTDAERRVVNREATKARLRWPEIVTTQGRMTAVGEEAYVVEPVGLPVSNPWRRNVRIADLSFLPDGRAVAVTFDGDVWLVSGLEGELREVRWKRYASGLHEPLGIAVRAGEVFVHDRNGLWILRDRDGNGEADEHVLFCGAFTQTAETREFASGLRVTSDGSFVIAKGGQRGATLSAHSGSVLRIAPDGSEVRVLGHGFRQPFLGVHPVEGWVTVSDQQGHYVPATPVHVLSGDTYHGFLPLILPKNEHPEPIEEPRLWIPHPINASAAGQVWLSGGKMGPLTDALIHLGYYRPEIFVVNLDPRHSEKGASVVSLTRDLEFPPLAGAMGARDGQLYVTGFQIWGSTAKETSGLARVRFTGGESLIPRGIEAMEQGVLLRFDVVLDRSMAADPGNFSAERWNYRRTAEYGSPHFRLDGSKGQESLVASSAYVSRDGRSVFLGIPDMRPVMQMRVGWGLKTASGRAMAQSGYLTPGALKRWDAVATGFEPVEVNLTPRAPAETRRPTPMDAAEGKRLAEWMGCVACHSTDGSTLGKVGPSWKGIWGTVRKFADGTSRKVDEGYVRDSIREPSAQVVEGFQTSDTGMPSYEGVMNDEQVTALVRFIESMASP